MTKIKSKFARCYIRTGLSNVFTKTGSKNRVALLNWAMDTGKICRDGFNCWALPDADGPE